MEIVSGSGRRRSVFRISRRCLVTTVSVVVVVLTFLAAGCSGAVAPSPTATTSGQPKTAAVSFANPDLLVETDWLAQKLSDPGIRIIDARTADEYKGGHIKGAVSIPMESTFLPGAAAGIVGSPEQIASIFGGKGIADDARVIVYDAGKQYKASRILWTLEYYGHKRVSVLNGGFKKWQKESKETSTAEPSVTPAQLTVKAVPGRRDLLNDMRSAVGKPGVVIIDARSPAEYSGDQANAKRGGHIPGAINVDWVNLFNPDDTFKSAGEIAKVYEDKGITKDKEAHAY